MNSAHCSLLLAVLMVVPTQALAEQDENTAPISVISQPIEQAAVKQSELESLYPGESEMDSQEAEENGQDRVGEDPVTTDDSDPNGDVGAFEFEASDPRLSITPVRATRNWYRSTETLYVRFDGEIHFQSAQRTQLGDGYKLKPNRNIRRASVDYVRQGKSVGQGGRQYTKSARHRNDAHLYEAHVVAYDSPGIGDKHTTYFSPRWYYW